MSERKRYMAQEMREIAESMTYGDDESSMEFVIAEIGDNLTLRESVYETNTVAAILRQAADAEEELAKLRESKNRWMQYQETAAGERNACIDELRKKDAEIAQLKARLDAVVKECETEKSKWIPAMEYESVVKRSSMVDRYDRILRAARGESENENK